MYVSACLSVSVCVYAHVSLFVCMCVSACGLVYLCLGACIVQMKLGQEIRSLTSL